jgi:GTP pyrophosphokinase
MVSITNSLPKSSTGDTLDIKVWVEGITKNRPAAEQQAIKDAYNWAKDVHQSQTRASGEPFVTHVINVANTLAQLGMDTNVLVAAILHDVVEEDQQIMLEEIQKRCGDQVTRLVDGVAKMKFIEELNDNSHKTINTHHQIEKLRKMLLAMAEDVRVVLIKLADRLDNMRVLRHKPADKQRRMARETLDLFAPLANRLGIWQIKWELEDLSLRYLEPETYKKLARLLDERRIDRENYIQQMMTRLSAALKKAEIKAEISGRPKHIYSIWRKMQKKGLDFDEIFDVRALRVLVESENECYMVLGVIHNQWQPLSSEFDDYIANPKNNNYKSLHTAVIGPDHKIFEVQIRTHSMHHHAELGVAAHWRYKEDGSQHDDGFEQKIVWLRQILQRKDEDGNASDLLDRFKSEIFEDRVYVFSPQEEVIDLQLGATPLDFAYHIHTELGHRCRGAKINRRIVPLTYTLKNGDMVEILTAKEEKPSRDWLISQAGYLKTLKARTEVKRWLKKQDIEKNIGDGRNLLERSLRRLNIRNYNIEQLAQSLGFKSEDEFLASMGRGDTTFSHIASTFKEQVLHKKKKVLPMIAENRRPQDDIHVKGVGGLLTQTASCCKPVPYEPIVGYITKMRGVMVHRRDCPNALHWQEEGSERLIEVDWSRHEGEQAFVYPVDILISGFDRTGLLHDICSIVANEKINILACNTITNRIDSSVDMKFTFEVSSLEQLSRALGKIDGLINVMSVWRKS